MTADRRAPGQSHTRDSGTAQDFWHPTGHHTNIPLQPTRTRAHSLTTRPEVTFSHRIPQVRSCPLIRGFSASSSMLTDEALLPKGTETSVDGIG